MVFEDRGETGCWSGQFLEHSGDPGLECLFGRVGTKGRRRAEECGRVCKLPHGGAVSGADVSLVCYMWVTLMVENRG